MIARLNLDSSTGSSGARKAVAAPNPKRSRATATAACPSDARGAQTDSDETLFERYRKKGDEDAFRQLVIRYERELFSYLHRLLGARDIAQDVFQETFLRVHLKRETFDRTRRFKPWLYTIATNRAIDRQRARKHRRAVSLDEAHAGDESHSGYTLKQFAASSDPEPPQQIDTAERHQEVRGVVDALPEHQRRAVMLIFFKGMKYREAADVLGIPVGTVKSRLHQAFRNMERQLGTVAWT